MTLGPVLLKGGAHLIPQDHFEEAGHVTHTLWTVNFQRKRPSNISFPIFHCIIPADGAQNGGVMACRHLIAERAHNHREKMLISSYAPQVCSFKSRNNLSIEKSCKLRCHLITSQNCNNNERTKHSSMYCWPELKNKTGKVKVAFFF